MKREMMMKHTLNTLTLMAALLAFSTAEARTQAQECTSDADCPESYTCISEDFDACPPCESGMQCEPCGSTSYSYCSPPPPEECESDADCEGDNVCVSYTYESCMGGDVVCAADPDGNTNCDDEPEVEVNCESHSEAYCVPPYYAPCQVDADCGGGFACKDIEICSCSSDPSPEPDPGTGSGSDGAPDEGSCECGPTGDKYCELIPVECETDADCGSGQTCQDLYGGETEPAPLPVDDPGTMDGDTGDTGSGEIMPYPEESYCIPDGYWGTPVYSGDDSAGEQAPVGNASGAERVGWGEGDSSGSKATDSGCSATNSNATLGWLGLFGLIALRRRRASRSNR